MEDEGGASVEMGGGVGLELEEGEIGVRVRRRKVRRRRVFGGEAVGVGERRAFGARGMVVNWGFGKGKVVKVETAEGRRVEAEDAEGAEEAVDTCGNGIGPTCGCGCWCRTRLIGLLCSNCYILIGLLVMVMVGFDLCWDWRVWRGSFDYWYWGQG